MLPIRPLGLPALPTQPTELTPDLGQGKKEGVVSKVGGTVAVPTAPADLPPPDLGTATKSAKPTVISFPTAGQIDNFTVGPAQATVLPAGYNASMGVVYTPPPPTLYSIPSSISTVVVATSLLPNQTNRTATETLYTPAGEGGGAAISSFDDASISSLTVSSINGFTPEDLASSSFSTVVVSSIQMGQLNSSNLSSFPDIQLRSASTNQGLEICNFDGTPTTFGGFIAPFHYFSSGQTTPNMQLIQSGSNEGGVSVDTPAWAGANPYSWIPFGLAPGTTPLETDFVRTGLVFADTHMGAGYLFKSPITPSTVVGRIEGDAVVQNEMNFKFVSTLNMGDLNTDQTFMSMNYSSIVMQDPIVDINPGNPEPYFEGSWRNGTSISATSSIPFALNVNGAQNISTLLVVRDVSTQALEVSTINGFPYSGVPSSISSLNEWSYEPAISTVNLAGNNIISVADLQVSSINGQTPGSGGGNVSTFDIASISSLTVSSINGAEINSQQIIISTVNTQSINTVSFSANFVGVSSINFNPSLSPSFTFPLQIGLGSAAGFATGLLGATVANVALNTGITALLQQRPDATTQINSNVFELVNTTTQIQYSTLGTTFSTIYRFTDQGENANSVFGNEVFISTINPPGLAVRSLSDPLNTASSVSTYIQSFGQWVPVPGGGSISSLEEWYLYPAQSSIVFSTNGVEGNLTISSVGLYFNGNEVYTTSNIPVIPSSISSLAEWSYEPAISTIVFSNGVQPNFTTPSSNTSFYFTTNSSSFAQIGVSAVEFYNGSLPSSATSVALFYNASNNHMQLFTGSTTTLANQADFYSTISTAALIASTITLQPGTPFPVPGPEYITADLNGTSVSTNQFQVNSVLPMVIGNGVTQGSLYCGDASISSISMSSMNGTSWSTMSLYNQQGTYNVVAGSNDAIFVFATGNTGTSSILTAGSYDKPSFLNLLRGAINGLGAPFDTITLDYNPAGVLAFGGQCNSGISFSPTGNGTNVGPSPVFSNVMAANAQLLGGTYPDIYGGAGGLFLLPFPASNTKVPFGADMAFSSIVCPSILTSTMTVEEMVINNIYTVGLYASTVNADSTFSLAVNTTDISTTSVIANSLSTVNLDGALVNISSLTGNYINTTVVQGGTLSTLFLDCASTFSRTVSTGRIDGNFNDINSRVEMGQALFGLAYISTFFVSSINNNPYTDPQFSTLNTAESTITGTLDCFFGNFDALRVVSGAEISSLAVMAGSASSFSTNFLSVSTLDVMGASVSSLTAGSVGVSTLDALVCSVSSIQGNSANMSSTSTIYSFVSSLVADEHIVGTLDANDIFAESANISSISTLNLTTSTLTADVIEAQFLSSSTAVFSSVIAEQVSVSSIVGGNATISSIQGNVGLLSTLTATSSIVADTIQCSSIQAISSISSATLQAGTRFYYTQVEQPMIQFGRSTFQATPLQITLPTAYSTATDYVVFVQTTDKHAFYASTINSSTFETDIASAGIGSEFYWQTLGYPI